ELHWRMKHRQQAATVSDNWKYLRVDGHEYLFDIVADGRERANLAKRHPDRLSELREHWHAWAKTMPGIPEDAVAHLLWDERDMPRSTFCSGRPSIPWPRRLVGFIRVVLGLARGRVPVTPPPPPNEMSRSRRPPQCPKSSHQPTYRFRHSITWVARS